MKRVNRDQSVHLPVSIAIASYSCTIAEKDIKYEKYVEAQKYAQVDKEADLGSDWLVLVY